MSRVFQLRVVFLALISVSVLVAQQGRGVIFGMVTDPSGAPIAGVNVQVTNVDTGIVTTAQSGPEGDYTTPGIAVGSYTVSVDQPGFKSLVRSGIVIQVDQRAEVKLQLTVGSVQ